MLPKHPDPQSPTTRLPQPPNHPNTSQATSTSAQRYLHSPALRSRLESARLRSFPTPLKPPPHPATTHKTTPRPPKRTRPDISLRPSKYPDRRYKTTRPRKAPLPLAHKPPGLTPRYHSRPARTSTKLPSKAPCLPLLPDLKQPCYDLHPRCSGLTCFHAVSFRATNL